MSDRGGVSRLPIDRGGVRPGRRIVAGLTGGLAAAVLLAACSSGSSVHSATGPGSKLPATTVPTGPAPLYVAVGASETTGTGTDVPLLQAWPRVLYRDAMPQRTVFVNMGIPGATLSQALQQEVGPTVALRPTIVTVWLNVNDILAGVSAADFEGDLGNLVHQLRRGGATRVLVANTPPVDGLPAYLACRPDPPVALPPCRADTVLPPPDQVDALVDAYNAATQRIVTREGAALVDLHALGLAERQAGIADALISSDGFHPNAGGAQAVATAFGDVLRQTGPLG